MDLIAKFLFLSGKFITYATGRTILAIIHQSVKFHRHLACKYEELTQVVKPYDSMVELLNARTDDSTIENLNLPSVDVCSQTASQTTQDEATRTLHLDVYLPEDLREKDERCEDMFHVCKDSNGRPIDLRSIVVEDAELDNNTNEPDLQLYPGVRAVDSADTIADVLSLPLEVKVESTGPETTAKRDHINTVASLRKQEYTRQCFYGNFLKDCGEGFMMNAGMMSSCSKYSHINHLLSQAHPPNSFCKQYSIDEHTESSKDKMAEFVGPVETNEGNVQEQELNNVKTSWETFIDNINNQCGPTEILRNPTDDLGEHPTSRPSKIDPSWEAFTSNLQGGRLTTAEVEVNTDHPQHQLIRDTTWHGFYKNMEKGCMTDRIATIPEEPITDISWEAFNTRLHTQFKSSDVVEVYKELLRQEELENLPIADKTEGPTLENNTPWQTCDIHLHGKNVNSTTFRKLSSSSKGDDPLRFIKMLMKEVEDDSELININQQAFNKLEKKVTQILIQQSLADKDQVTSKGNFFEVHRNASQKIRKALLQRSRERLTRALSNIEKDRYSNEKRLAQQTDDMLFPSKQKDILIAKLKHLQVLTKEINKICEMDGMEKFPVKQDRKPKKVIVMQPEQLKKIARFNMPKKWQTPTATQVKPEEATSGTPKVSSDHDQPENVKERLRVMEANLKAFKIFEDYIQNLSNTNKSSVVAQKNYLKEKIRKTVERNRMEIAARNDKKTKVEREAATKPAKEEEEIPKVEVKVKTDNIKKEEKVSSESEKRYPYFSPGKTVKVVKVEKEVEKKPKADVILKTNETKKDEKEPSESERRYSFFLPGYTKTDKRGEEPDAKKGEPQPPRIVVKENKRNTGDNEKDNTDKDPGKEKQDDKRRKPTSNREHSGSSGRFKYVGRKGDTNEGSMSKYGKTGDGQAMRDDDPPDDKRYNFPHHQEQREPRTSKVPGRRRSQEEQDLYEQQEGHLKLESKRNKGDNKKDITDKDPGKEKQDDKLRKPTTTRERSGSSGRFKYVGRKGDTNEGSMSKYGNTGDNPAMRDDDPPDDKKYKFPHHQEQRESRTSKVVGRRRSQEEQDLYEQQERYRYRYNRKTEDQERMETRSQKGDKTDENKPNKEATKPSDIILNYTIPYNIPYKHKYEKIADELKAPSSPTARKRPWMPRTKKEKLLAAAKAQEDAKPLPEPRPAKRDAIIVVRKPISNQDEEKPSDIIDKYNFNNHTTANEYGDDRKTPSHPINQTKKERLKAIRAKLTAEAAERDRLANQDRTSRLSVDHRIEDSKTQDNINRDDVQSMDKESKPHEPDDLLRRSRDDEHILSEQTHRRQHGKDDVHPSDKPKDDSRVSAREREHIPSEDVNNPYVVDNQSTYKVDDDLDDHGKLRDRKQLLDLQDNNQNEAPHQTDIPTEDIRKVSVETTVDDGVDEHGKLRDRKQLLGLSDRSQKDAPRQNDTPPKELNGIPVAESQPASKVDDGVDEYGKLRDRKQLLSLQDRSQKDPLRQHDIPQETKRDDRSPSHLDSRPQQMQPEKATPPKEQKDPSYKIKEEKAVKLMEAMQKEKDSELKDSAASVDHEQTNVPDSDIKHIKLKLWKQPVQLDPRHTEPKEVSKESKKAPETEQEQPNYKAKEEKAVELMKIQEMEAKKRLVRIDIEFEEPHRDQKEVGMTPEKTHEALGEREPQKFEEQKALPKYPAEDKNLQKTSDEINKNEMADREKAAQRAETRRAVNVAVPDETYAALKKRNESPEEVRRRVLDIARSEYSRGKSPEEVEDEHNVRSLARRSAQKESQSIPRKDRTSASIKSEGMPNKQKGKPRSLSTPPETEARTKMATPKDEKSRIAKREKQMKQSRQPDEKLRKDIKPAVVEVHDVRYIERKEKTRKAVRASEDKELLRKLKAAESDALLAKKSTRKASRSEGTKSGDKQPEYASSRYLAERGKGAYKARSPRPERQHKTPDQASKKGVQDLEREKQLQSIRSQKVAAALGKNDHKSQDGSVDREPTKEVTSPKSSEPLKTIQSTVKHTVGKRPEGIPRKITSPEEKSKLTQTSEAQQKISGRPRKEIPKDFVAHPVKTPASRTSTPAVTPDALPDDTLQSKFATRSKREKQRTIVDKHTGMVTKEQQVEITEMYVEKHDGVEQDLILKGKSPKPKTIDGGSQTAQKAGAEEAKPKLTFAERRKAYLDKLRQQNQEAKLTAGTLEAPSKLQTVSKATSTPKKMDIDKVTIHEDIVEAIQEENSMAMTEVDKYQPTSAYDKMHLDVDLKTSTIAHQKSEDMHISVAEDSVEDNREEQSREQQWAAAIEERILSSSQEQTDEKITEYIKNEQVKPQDLDKMKNLIAKSGITPSDGKMMAFDEDSVEENKEHHIASSPELQTEEQKVSPKPADDMTTQDMPSKKEIKLPPDAIYMANLYPTPFKEQSEPASGDKTEPLKAEETPTSSKRYIVTDTAAKSNLLKDDKIEDVDKDSVEANKPEYTSIYETVYQHTIAAAKKVEDTQLLTAKEIVENKRKEEQRRAKFSMDVKPAKQQTSAPTVKDVYSASIKRAGKQSPSFTREEQKVTGDQQPAVEKAGMIEQIAKDMSSIAKEALKTEVQQNLVEQHVGERQKAQKVVIEEEIIIKDKKPTDSESAKMSKLIEEKWLKARQKSIEEQVAETQKRQEVENENILTNKSGPDPDSGKVSKMMDGKATTPLVQDREPGDPSHVKINPNRLRWDSAVADALKKARQANASEPKSELIANPKNIQQEADKIKMGAESEPKIAEPDQKAADEVLAKYAVETKIEPIAPSIAEEVDKAKNQEVSHLSSAEKTAEKQEEVRAKLRDAYAVEYPPPVKDDLPATSDANIKVMPRLKQRAKKAKPKVNVEVKVTYTKKVERKIRESIAKIIPRTTQDELPNEKPEEKKPQDDNDAEIRLHPPEGKPKYKKRRPTKLYKPYIPGINETDSPETRKRKLSEESADAKKPRRNDGVENKTDGGLTSGNDDENMGKK